MEFIKNELPINVAASKDILKTRRVQLRLTQQQVANGARIQLQQYQRLESGERNIENASMRIAISICAVLKLDPFCLFPEAAAMNKYADSVKRTGEPLLKEEAIPLILEHACNLCNEVLYTHYSLENIKIACCTLENAVTVYNDFTAQYGFHSEVRSNSDFEDVLAESFVGQTDIDDPAHVDGILIRTDPPANIGDPESYLLLLVHELSHIFCTTHETDTAGKVGQRFYDLYCADEPGTPASEYNNGYMNAGYAIWRGFIADIIQDIVYQQPSKHLTDIAPFLRILADRVKVGNSIAKSALHRYLSEIMNTWEGSEAEKWVDLESKLLALNLPFIRIVKHVFENLHGKNCHTITPEFIESLGALCLADMIQNTPNEDIMRFSEIYGYTFSNEEGSDE